MSLPSPTSPRSPGPRTQTPRPGSSTLAPSGARLPVLGQPPRQSHEAHGCCRPSHVCPRRPNGHEPRHGEKTLCVYTSFLLRTLACQPRPLPPVLGAPSRAPLTPWEADATRYMWSRIEDTDALANMTVDTIRDSTKLIEETVRLSIARGDEAACMAGTRLHLTGPLCAPVLAGDRSQPDQQPVSPRPGFLPHVPGLRALDAAAVPAFRRRQVPHRLLRTDALRQVT